ncbi:MAG: LysR family transcriptional regulator [Lachnospiraceae bacterium]|nr:LysR family transcriptional regulator [Lachnospiraceae bacterium]
MTLKQIEYVLELSRTLNFRQTAENLYISQPALSYQIHTLEEELGVELFRRSGHGVSLTVAGDSFCRKMSGIYSASQDVISTIRNYGDSCEDVLRVGFFHIHTQTLFPEILRRFSEKYPAVAVEPQLIHGVGRIDALLRGELDMILFTKEQFPKTSDCLFWPLYRSKIYCAMHESCDLAKSTRITPELLTGHTICLCSGEGPMPLLKAQNTLCATQPVKSVLCKDADTAMLLVSARQGIALMPGFCHIPNPALRWLLYDYPETIEGGICIPKNRVRPVTEAFYAIAREVYVEAEENGKII